MSTIREELTRIYLRDGQLTDEAVLADATDESSALHSHFTWDDTEAAHKRRLDEARALIRRCKIRVEVPEDRTVNVRAFLHVPAVGDVEATYAPIGKVMANLAHRELVLKQALRDIAVLERKYRDLIDFDVVLDAAVAARKRKKPAA